MKYRKKPVVIEAIQWMGNNFIEINKFVTVSHKIDRNIKTVLIPTLEGEMIANNGDYIIKGVNGEFYPCKPDIFIKTYDKA